MFVPFMGMARKIVDIYLCSSVQVVGQGCAVMGYELCMGW